MTRLIRRSYSRRLEGAFMLGLCFTCVPWLQTDADGFMRLKSALDDLQLLHAVEHGVEYGSWNAHSFIVIERTEFIDVSIRFSANNRQSIEKSEIQFAVLPAHCTPNIPWQHLTVVQSSD